MAEILRAPNPDECQIRFKYFMIDNGLKEGDAYRGYDFINWISEVGAEYKKSIGKHYLDILTPHEQAKFTEFIRIRVKGRTGVER
ncbi:hypothetical protein P4U97_21610 [Bacillus swezeyi]|uniref:hypothetical protein n=1 Tax=Bacillus swezeyi TaxID=1925020 RepID=UPI002E1EBCF6|nr:hypothetical protein [Bacillus swezeyi]